MTATELHPLVSRVEGCIKDWDDWLNRWAEATAAEEFVGLLHYGFRLKRAPEGERLRFYLKVADGHHCPYLQLASDNPRSLVSIFSTEDERASGAATAKWYSVFSREPLELVRLRRIVAEEAWKRLCLSEKFKMDGWHGFTADYTEDGFKTLDTLLWFFGPERLDNLPSYSLEQGDPGIHARDLLMSLARWMWKLSIRSERMSDELKAKFEERVTAARKDFIVVLDKIGALGLLTELVHWPQPDTMPTLLEVALTRKHSMETRYADIDEALCSGATAAMIYVMLERKIASLNR